jgi:hypothetical protein
MHLGDNGVEARATLAVDVIAERMQLGRPARIGGRRQVDCRCRSHRGR